MDTVTQKHSNKHILWILITTVLILMVSHVAMQFTDEVNWGLFDFIIVGTLLIGSGLIFGLLSRKMPKATHRLVLAFVMGGLLFLAWAELAVGIFGTPFAGS